MRSPSASKSTTPRSERPIRRWISTVRPSWRPRVASRCLRSPVDAGSIPYSAVTQPVPRPAIQRGTLSSRRGRADHARLADRDQRRAGRRAHEARLDLDRAQLARAAPVAARRCVRLAHATASTAASSHVLDLAERHLQEARAELREGLRVAGAEEAVVALAARAGCPARACSARARPGARAPRPS